jgi:hypothetical protein
VKGEGGEGERRRKRRTEKTRGRRNERMWRESVRTGSDFCLGISDVSTPVPEFPSRSLFALSNLLYLFPGLKLETPIESLYVSYRSFFLFLEKFVPERNFKYDPRNSNFGKISKLFLI